MQHETEMTAAEKKKADKELLDALAKQELEINRLLSSAAGTAEEINNMLQQQGVFEEYRQIHKAYVALTSFKRDRGTRNEALKRALFLSWYHELEPAPFSGLADLDEDKITEVYLVLNKVMERGWLNEEFYWMLAHYARWDWVILQHTENKIHMVSNWIKEVREQDHPLPVGALPAGSMHMRGLMGLYFKELGVEAAQPPRE